MTKRRPRAKPEPEEPRGDHPRAKRRPVQMPERFHDLLKLVAARQKQPEVWVLIELLHGRAGELGIEHLPPLPWEEASR